MASGKELRATSLPQPWWQRRKRPSDGPALLKAARPEHGPVFGGKQGEASHPQRDLVAWRLCEACLDGEAASIMLFE
jgi:hypothetical protein